MSAVKYRICVPSRLSQDHNVVVLIQCFKHSGIDYSVDFTVKGGVYYMSSVAEVDLVVKRDVRDTFMERIDVLDKVKALATLPDNTHVTTRMVADYYEVDKKVIDAMSVLHRDELSSDGMRLVNGYELYELKQQLMCLNDFSAYKRINRLLLFPRRAVLRVGMLLRDSDVAKQVRSYLLNVEATATTPHRMDAAQRTDVPTDFLGALRLAVQIEEERLALQQRLDEATPKVEMYDAFMSADTGLSIERVAKSIGWKRNTLFAFLRDQRIITKENVPYQRYLDQGLFDVKITPNNGMNFTQTLVRPRGHEFITRLVRERGLAFLTLRGRDS